MKNNKNTRIEVINKVNVERRIHHQVSAHVSHKPYCYVFDNVCEPVGITTWNNFVIPIGNQLKEIYK